MLKLYTGSYVGDSTDGRVIVTGASGTIRLLRILQNPAAHAEKSDAMPGNTFWAAGSPFLPGLSLGPDGNFTVSSTGSGGIINQLAGVYYWTALAE